MPVRQLAVATAIVIVSVSVKWNQFRPLVVNYIAM